MRVGLGDIRDTDKVRNHGIRKSYTGAIHDPTVYGYIPTRVIYVAAKLELTDHIRDGGACAQDLAQKLKVDPAALYRVMRVLAGLGVLRQDDNDRFYVTPFGETLRKDSPQSVRDYAIYSHEFVYDAFRGITDSVRTGKPVIDDLFGFLRANPDQETIFHAGMSNRGRIEAVADGTYFIAQPFHCAVGTKPETVG